MFCFHSINQSSFRCCFGLYLLSTCSLDASGHVEMLLVHPLKYMLHFSSNLLKDFFAFFALYSARQGECVQTTH